MLYINNFTNSLTQLNEIKKKILQTSEKPIYIHNGDQNYYSNFPFKNCQSLNVFCFQLLYIIISI